MASLNELEILRCSKCRLFPGYNEQHLPVIAFGDPKAPVMLLSLNPSYNEYRVSKHGDSPLIPLSKGERVLASESELLTATQRQEQYFETGFHYDWFDDAEYFLNQLRTSAGEEVSFGLNGKAALVQNVDIVKCATNPTWGRLDRDVQQQYMGNCFAHLIEQLFSATTKVIVLNGAGVAKAMRALSRTTDTFKMSLKTSPKVTMIQTLKNGEQRTTTSSWYTGYLKRQGKMVLLTGTTGRISADHGPVFLNHDKTPANNSEELFNSIQQVIHSVM